MVIKKNKMIKHNRILDLCMRFMAGEVINKKEAAEKYDVNERSIQRDIDDLRMFFFEKSEVGEEEFDLIYNYAEKGYQLKRNVDDVLSSGEFLVVCKILLESRAFTKEELFKILDKLINKYSTGVDIYGIKKMILNECHYYIEPHHGEKIIGKIWTIGKAIQGENVIHIKYKKQNGVFVDRTIKPVGLMFSEYYFYLMAFIDNIDKEKEFNNIEDMFPTIYRIDRIRTINILDQHFSITYKNRFQEGEFRKRVQFMYGGKLQRIRFEYTGPSVESVLDRLPTAIIEKSIGNKFVICAEVFGLGIEMWFKSQGSMVKVLESQELVNKLLADFEQTRKLYFS